MSRKKKSSSLNAPQVQKPVYKEPKVLNNVIVIDSDELEHKVLDNINVTDKNETSHHELYYPNFWNSDLLGSIELSIDHLIGSSRERASLIAEQDDMLQQSQAYDLFKIEEKAYEEAKEADLVIRANQLRMEHLNRVPRAC